MRFSELREHFHDNVVRATICAPDNYPDWDTGGYPLHKAELLNKWAEIRCQVKRDTDKVTLIDEKLALALESFDRGERQPGQSLMFEIYNILNAQKLR